MWFSKEQKFLYSRVVILVAAAGAIASAFAGLNGFPFWYGGFVLSFWVAFGLLNYSEHTSLWLSVHRRIPFLLFFGALAAVLVFLDQCALDAHLWFYPFYTGWWFLWVYLVLYPFSALGQLELLYFLARCFGEKLSFRHRPDSRRHNLLDGAEGFVFLCMIGSFILGAAGVSISLSLIFWLSICWLLLATVKLAFHTTHPRHYIFLLVTVGVIAAFLNELPTTVSFEWVYLEGPMLTFAILGVPLWVWLGWYWYALLTLRLWIFLVLHPKVK